MDKETAEQLLAAMENAHERTPDTHALVEFVADELTAGRSVEDVTTTLTEGGPG